MAGKTFATRREAQAWLTRERASLAGGVDPRAGRPTVRALLPIWLDERRHAVSAKTFKSDAALPRLVPTSLAALQVGAVTDREVSRALIALVRNGLAESSVKRFRDSLSSVLRLGGARANDPDKPGDADPGAQGKRAASRDVSLQRGRA